jgi:hypothetical protein
MAISAINAPKPPDWQIAGLIHRDAPAAGA